jgi:hypothetical protein
MKRWRLVRAAIGGSCPGTQPALLPGMTTTFEAGKTYRVRSIGDHNCIYEITVASRTAKFITTTEGKRLGVSIYEDSEQVYPHGHYSMCACIRATGTKVLLTDWQVSAQRKADAAKAVAEKSTEIGLAAALVAFQRSVTALQPPIVEPAAESRFVFRLSIVPVKHQCGHVMLRLLRDPSITVAHAPCEVCRGDLSQADADAHNLEVLRHG